MPLSDQAEIGRNICKEVKPLIDKVLSALQMKILKNATPDRHSKIDQTLRE